MPVDTRPVSRLRWIALAACLAAAALVVLGLRLRAGAERGATGSPLVGHPAPDFSLPVLGDPDRRIGNRDLLGEPFLLEAWDSTCAQCRDGHAVVVELARSGRVRVVGFNLGDRPADARRWLQQFDDPYHANLSDPDGRAARDWGIRGAPEFFLVDARGIVRWRHVGPLDADVVRDDVLPTLESAR
jgi:cytochrome c biogenesis protein CcmG/thiol:disulfide interchange protein DsbE